MIIMMIIGADLFAEEISALYLLPMRLRRYFGGVDTADIREVRLRVGRAVRILTSDGIKILSRSARLMDSDKNGVVVTRADIADAVEILTASSLYSFQNEIKDGYITAPNGCRVGLCGTMTPDGEFVDDIYSLNYRFAREIKGAADKAVYRVYNGGDIKSTLIVSKPGCGKTTFLRDLVRQISDRGIAVSVVDERGELSADGDSFDLGENTDVFRMCEKDRGLKMMIRSMSPRVAAVDEIGGRADIDAIRFAAKSGVAVFATIHASDWKRDISEEILSCFKCVIQLSDRHGAGYIEEIVNV